MLPNLITPQTTLLNHPQPPPCSGGGPRTPRPKPPPPPSVLGGGASDTRPKSPPLQGGVAEFLRRGGNGRWGGLLFIPQNTKHVADKTRPVSGQL